MSVSNHPQLAFTANGYYNDPVGQLLLFGVQVMPVQYEGMSAALSAAPSVSLRATGVLPRSIAAFTVTVTEVWFA